MAAHIEFIRVGKTFGDCVAARSLTFSVRRGSIHGIIGENGAGKSTAMKMLFGMYRPDAGEIRIDGKVIDFSSPNDAFRARIGMVHQHFMLAEPMTALDNLLLAQDGGPCQILNRKAALLKYRALAERYGFEIDFERPVEELPVGVQQRLEILKVLAHDAEILILDEPTAVLTPQEVRDFFGQVRRLRDEGRTVLIISHKLREIMELADDVTVFRQGTTVAERKTSETSIEELAELMIGRKDVHPKSKAVSPGETLLRLSGLGLRGPTGLLQDLNLEVRAGEIVGIAGVEGNGQDVLLRLMSEGAHRRDLLVGEGELLGLPMPEWSPASLRARGVAYFPEDRLRYGVLENRPAEENFLLGQQWRADFRKGPFIDQKKLHAAAAAAVREYHVQPPKLDLAIGRFSGGNQQKFVVARELAASPKMIVAAQPTRGVDLGAVRFIHGRLLEAKERGAGVLLISSELEELMELSDRIVVLYRGRFNARFDRAPFDEMKLGQAMGGREIAP